MFHQSTARCFDRDSLLWHEMLLFICKPGCVRNLTAFQTPQLMRLAAACIPWAQSIWYYFHVGCHSCVDFICFIGNIKTSIFMLQGKNFCFAYTPLVSLSIQIVDILLHAIFLQNNVLSRWNMNRYFLLNDLDIWIDIVSKICIFSMLISSST